MWYRLYMSRARLGPALGPFLDTLGGLLDELGPDELRLRILAHARQLEGPDRVRLLAAFQPARPAKAAGAVTPSASVKDATLLQDITVFVDAVAGGQHDEGWGWDHDLHDDRAWGDESWATEIDDLFDRAAAHFVRGDRRLATDAYGALIEALELDQDGGTFCGPVPAAETLNIDLREAAARWAGAILDTSEPGERFERLLRAFDGAHWFADVDLGVQDVLDADSPTPPGLGDRLLQWAAFLRRVGPGGLRADRVYDRLLRESARMTGGVVALAALARERGGADPHVYREWISALADGGDVDGVIAAGHEAASALEDPCSRASLADLVAAVAGDASRLGAALEARQLALNSRPTLTRLVSLIAEGDRAPLGAVGGPRQAERA